MTTDAAPQAPRDPTTDIEQGSVFVPRFGADGLIGAIVTDRQTGDVLMFAHMNAEALRLTLATGQAHFWSRSRGKLWRKGEDSGNLLTVREVRTDCDQDVVLLVVDIGGRGVACHTGARSCFYRRIKPGTPDAETPALEHIAVPKK